MKGGEWNVKQVEALVGIWGEIFDEVRACERQYDQWMLRSYLKHKGLDKVDVCFAFTEGDWVVRLARREGKLSPKAWGPYNFIKYTGPTCKTAKVQEAASGKVLMVSMAYLRPLHPEHA